MDFAGRIRKKIERKEEITESDAVSILNTKHSPELAELFSFADELNRDVNGDIVTYVSNRNINYTNICELSCKFCAFSRKPSDRDARRLTAREILEKVGENPISEVCLQGGIDSFYSFEDVLGIVRKIKSEYPKIHLHAFSPMEILYFSGRSGLRTAEVLSELKAGGMDSLCGTAAEILDDGLRKKICEGKLSSGEWIRIIKEAHSLGIPSSATILFGSIENDEQIVRHFSLIREIQRETGMITEFIPLPFTPYKTRLAREHDVSFVDFTKAKKVTALARLFFHGFIRNIQTSWVKLGFERALECLSAGANDLGGTLFEENITRLAGGVHGEYKSAEEFKEAIGKLGKIPFERDTVYGFQKRSVKEDGEPRFKTCVVTYLCTCMKLHNTHDDGGENGRSRT